ncbi:hypothetical protein [Roseicyclus persicicus]|uniref:Lipoprotein n=1 Tax=Roseicyclus persicicus TaxID=2650661 RepID=A0A7X6GVQ1_9RHOB|nr:hypothetical protein [Roseibacterium persicicum]NKX43262.1 hypothetical protein [Roseibacterium persicicum]
MIRAGRLLAALVVVAALAGCAAEEVVAPEAVVSASAYRPGGTPTLSLITMISNRSGSGGHSALLIDGEQRILFDPAGSWHHPMIPERNDVLYGMSPQFMGFYMDYHARETYHVVVQELEISPATAASLIAAVQAAGPVPQAQCSLSISRVLSQTPGFESIGTSWFPARTMERFARLPGVQESRIYDDDSDDNLELLQAQARAALSQQQAAAAAQN